MTVCGRTMGDRGMLLLALLSVTVKCNSMSAPGKPVLLGCRSPEKETFTCWWEPGSDGGLPTTHRLFYERDNSEGVYECPDYRSAGGNSCFFDKAHTSIWVEYYVTVVASNALGNSTSDFLKMEVMEIVKPNTPENVTLVVEQIENSQCLHIRWEPPHNTDTKSGWVTIKYELRVKQENSDLWKEYTTGTQADFILYNISPGVMYMAQVRCRLDHGSWSEWSKATFIKIPNYFQKESTIWIVIAIVVIVSFIMSVCLLVTKRKHVRQCILPPVPSPKIRGVDVQLLKCGRTEAVANALIISQNFPSFVTLEDQNEDYIMVSDNDEGFLPDISSSQIRKKSLVIPAGFHSDFEIRENNDEVDNCVSQDGLSSVEPTQKQPCPGINFTIVAVTDQSSLNPTHSASENIVQPLADSSYVDLQIKADVEQVDYSRVKEVKGDNVIIVEREDASGFTDIQGQDEHIAQDYSRVKEVQGNYTVVLQKQNAAESSPGQKGNHYTDCTSDKLRSSLVTSPSTVGECTELSSQYVETVPSLLMYRELV